MDSHKLALIDSSTGEFKDIKVADDYVSVISLTLELQVSAHCLHNNYFSILQYDNHMLSIFYTNRKRQKIRDGLGSML